MLHDPHPDNGLETNFESIRAGPLERVEIQASQTIIRSLSQCSSAARSDHSPLTSRHRNLSENQAKRPVLQRDSA
jgi:hypothetical protein